MFRVNKKTIIVYASFVGFILFISLIIPALRIPLLNSLKQPLTILTFIRKEIGALVSYHRNFTQAEKLKKELDLLKNKLTTQNELYLENMRLKELLAFKQKSQLKLIASRVIGRSPDNWSSLIIIDKGKHKGVESQAAVITYLGLVGRIIESSDSCAKVMLINDPNFCVSAMVQRSRQVGLVCGTLGHHLIMKYLSEDTDITVGDVIITSGLNQAYPKGILIGTVIELGKEFSGLSRYAIIKPAVNLFTIEEVLIVIQ